MLPGDPNSKIVQGERIENLEGTYTPPVATIVGEREVHVIVSPPNPEPCCKKSEPCCEDCCGCVKLFYQDLKQCCGGFCSVISMIVLVFGPLACLIGGGFLLKNQTDDVTFGFGIALLVIGVATTCLWCFACCANAMLEDAFGRR